MPTEKIRELQQAQPFQPFRIHTADGRHFDVLHPEFVLLPPGARLAIVWHPNGTSSGAIEHIHLPLVTSLEVWAPSRIAPELQ